MSSFRFTASVLGQAQIPMCGPSQGSILLSDKRNYPYFFRIETGMGIGDHFVQAVKLFGAKRVAILQGSDALSYAGIIYTFRCTSPFIHSLPIKKKKKKKKKTLPSLRRS
jgi:hypothetical protein